MILVRKIEICCDDVGQSIVVIVEATDQHNNKSTCMTSVIVGDEIALKLMRGGKSTGHHYQL